MIQLFHDLNNHYFELFSDLDACSSVLPPEQYKTMATALKRAYDRDLEVVLGQKELETAQSTFELRYRLRHYVPRRSIFGWNRVARAMKKECLRQFREYLKCFDRLEDPAATPPDEPAPPDLHPVTVSTDPPAPTE